jgi:hypothetical protein
MESKESEEEEKERETITIFLQAHGYRLTDIHIPLDDAEHCEILSFTGSMGKTGTMKKNCNNLDIPPQEIVIPPQEMVTLPAMKIDGPQLDVMALSYVQQVYAHISQDSAIDDNKKSGLSFNVVKNGLPSVYANCDVTRFPYITRKLKSQIENAPFRFIPPLHDKEYQLHPNAHEDCREPSVCKLNDDCDECELLDKSEQFCPIYGIFIVSSSNKEDNEYTLCGSTALADDRENNIIANLNSEEGHSGGFTNFWENKINHQWDSIIRNESDVTKHRGLVIERDRIIALYRKLTRVLTSHSPTSTIILWGIEPLPVILLSELITIFIKGMGYDTINIIDPSCDSCVKVTDFKLAANKVLEKIRTRRLDTRRAEKSTRNVKWGVGLSTRKLRGKTVTFERIKRGGKRRSRRMKTRKVKRGKKVTYKRYKRY